MYCKVFVKIIDIISVFSDLEFEDELIYVTTFQISSFLEFNSFSGWSKVANFKFFTETERTFQQSMDINVDINGLSSKLSLERNSFVSTSKSSLKVQLLFLLFVGE